MDGRAVCGLSSFGQSMNSVAHEIRRRFDELRTVVAGYFAYTGLSENWPQVPRGKILRSKDHLQARRLLGNDGAMVF